MLRAHPRPTSLRRPESGHVKHQNLPRKADSLSGFRPRLGGRRPVIRAVISSGDGKAGVETAEKVVDDSRSLAASSSRGGINVRAVITIRKKMKERLTEKIEDQWESFMNGIGRGISIQFISEDIDPGLRMNYFCTVLSSQLGYLTLTPRGIRYH